MSHIQEQINLLVAVQGIENEILQSGRELAALDDAAAALDQELAEREAQLRADQKDLADLKKNYRQLEIESSINSGMIAKSNEKLPRVKTNKEYQSILKEIEDIQRNNSGLEDRMIAQLDQIESAEAAIRKTEVQLAAFLNTCREKKEAMAAKTRRERQRVAALNEKKVRISAKADPKIIMVLEDVKKKVRGMAVVAAQQAICTGCHMNIPAQLFNELHRLDELRFCPHCHRIIYWKEQVDE